MKRAIAVFLMTVLLLSSAYAESIFEQTVPFGLIYSEEPVDVYSLPTGGEAIGVLADGQVVAILDTQTTRCKILFYDDDGIEQKGYIQRKFLRQLSVSGLIKCMSDLEMREAINRFSEINTSADDFSIAAPSVTYILNIKSKKFHIPSCDSVNDMNPENKKEFFGTRDEAIKEGYTPCKRCNP